MLDFQQKRKFRSFMYSKTTIVILLIIVIILTNSTLRIYNKKRTSEDMKKISEKYVEELKERNLDLDYKLSRLDTEFGVEEEIRSRFGVVKEGENMVVIVPREEEIPEKVVNDSFWSRIKSFFGITGDQLSL